MKSINQSAVSLLEELKEVISQLADAQYAEPIKLLSHSSVGQHVRHTLEFFQCVERAKSTGLLNYDTRKHDGDLQENVGLAIGLLISIQNDFKKSEDDFAIEMEANYEIDEAEPIKIATSYRREIAYCMEHATHHMALIKIGLTSIFPDIDLHEDFGVATSTIRHLASQKP